MNRTESVSIGRKGFVCELDAYKVLQEYLKRSEESLADDPDQKEILSDLELSMAGHLSDLSGALVVDKQTAEKVISLMGEVEPNIDGDAKEKSTDTYDTEASGTSFADRLSAMLKKPLYKDHEREIADGVCAGIAKALDVDPVWVRLLFVVITIITNGVGILLYIVLSVVMKDKTSYKKKTAGEVVDSIREKITSTATSARPYERALRRLIGGVLIVVWVLLRTIVCIALVVASIAWASYMFFMLNSPDQVAIFNGRPGWLEFVMVFSAGLVLLIPIFELLVAMFRPKINRTRLSLTLWSVWALSLITFVASAINVYPKVVNYLETEQPKNDFVYVQMVGNEIASWCISPLGSCADMETILTSEPICGRNMTVYDKDDRPEWLRRGWVPNNESLEYPATEEDYCKRVREVFDREQMMIARQTLNSRTDVAFDRSDNSSPEFPQGILVPTDKEYWQFEYLTRN
jgi:phage shock protein PspC (stress-responsive transcriptional regulator)